MSRGSRNAMNNPPSIAVFNSSSNRRRRARNLLGEINVANIFPPFINNVDTIRTLLTRSDRRPRRRDYNGYDLFATIVSEEARIHNGVTDYYVVRMVASMLWRRSNRFQKEMYIQLAQEI